MDVKAPYNMQNIVLPCAIRHHNTIKDDLPGQHADLDKVHGN